VLGLTIVSAMLAAAPEVAASPAKVLLGATAEVTIEVHSSNAGALRSHASTGALSPKQVLGPNTARYTWTPPGDRFPQIAQVLFWTERGSNPPDLAVLRIPLVGRTDLEVNTEPRADVRVEVGDRSFGPRKADGRGHAVIPVEVPPGLEKAKVLSEVGGSSKAVEVALDPPPFNHLTVVMGPEPLPRSGGWAWVVASGALDQDTLDLKPSGGVASPWPAPPTTYPDRALLQVRPEGGAQSMTLTVRTRGPKDEATVSVDSEEPSLARPHALDKPLLQPGVFLGFTYAGGANLSVGGSVVLDVSVPPLGTAFAGGLALEGNTMGLSAQVAGLGRVDSWILSLSPLLVARYQFFEMGAVAFHVRGGGGPVFFAHQLRSSFEPSWNETGVTAQGFAGVEVTYRVGPLDMLLEARASYGRIHTESQVQTAQLDANIGGMVVGLGARVIR